MWEPRESKKGDVARAVFYYYTMYPDEGTNISRMWRFGRPSTIGT